MNNILVIGSINMDIVINTPRMPVLGETIIGGGFSVIPGGKGQNQAVAASRLGCDVKMLGAVGEDIYGKALIDSLTANGVDANGVQVKGETSGVAVITLCGGDNCIILDEGANKEIDIESINNGMELIKWADIVVFQFELPISTINHAIKLAAKHKKIIILNPAPMKNFDKDMLKYIDIFIPNQHEAGHLLGRSINTAAEGTKAVRDILSLGVKQVIITLGADGCVYNVADIIRHKKACDNINVVDTTAAGDSFVGGICKGLCSGYDTDKMIEYATTAAALTVGKKGAAISLPYENEVNACFRLEEGECVNENSYSS